MAERTKTDNSGNNWQGVEQGLGTLSNEVSQARSNGTPRDVAPGSITNPNT